MVTSTGPHAAMDWNHPVKRVERSGEGTNQSTYDWDDGTESKTEIAAHFDPNPEQDETRDDGGILFEGEARLFTETELDEEDEVEIHYDDSGTETERWIVKGLVRRHAAAAQLSGFPERFEYRIVRARDHS